MSAYLLQGSGLKEKKHTKAIFLSNKNTVQSTWYSYTVPEQQLSNSNMKRLKGLVFWNTKTLA